jgi:hypothetical protein
MQIKISHREDVWVVRVEQDHGKPQEFRCASEVQARQLARRLDALEHGLDAPPPKPKSPSLN